ncbi:hypothetical protein ACLB2K_004046 [Fragaria x ananassa]
MQGRLSRHIAELLAILIGIEVVIQRGWQVERIEADCLEAVNLMNETWECFAEDGVSVEKIRMLLSEVSRDVIVYTTRSTNVVAHSIAQFVARVEGRFTWLGVGPNWLMDVISNDRLVTVSSSGEMSGEPMSITDNFVVL